MASLAAFVIDTIAEVRIALAAEAADAGLAGAVVTRMTFSLPYDPGADGSPMPLPQGNGSIPIMRLTDAARHLVGEDRQVRLLERELRGAPVDRLARFELTIDMAADGGRTGR